LAGIYVHIPFCRRKCHYCNFFSLASKKLKSPFLQALKTEIELTRGYLDGEPVNTIYFGGGTPSVYRPGELQEIISTLDTTPPPGPLPKKGGGEPRPPATSLKNEQEKWIRKPDTANYQTTFSSTSPPSLFGEGQGEGLQEITMELNPEDVDEAYVEELKDTGFNRFSLGVQSFSDEDLVALNRSHSASQAIRAVKLLQRAGYENISIDLIYGIPASNDHIWRKNLELAFSLDVPHISAYALTVEPGTSLAWMIGKNRSAPVNEESQVTQFRLLMQMSRDNGFQQYEISNFAKPGWHAIHNTNYWNGVPYLGLGPSAHSFNRASRRWNISNLTEYITAMEKGELKYEEEILTPVQKFNEYVMTSLRTMWGCDLGNIKFKVQGSRFKVVRERALSFVRQGLITEQSGVFFLTDEGKLFADRIAAELFLTEDIE
jgi:oxygen-independent coproporphyrinogen-3 oxidase